MTGTSGRSSGSAEWPDDRLDAAYRARFDTDPPADLAERIRDEIAGRGHDAVRLGRFGRQLFGRRLAAPIGALAVVASLALVASLGSLAGRTPPIGEASGTPVPASGEIGGKLAGPPFPEAITAAGSTASQPVLSVSEALRFRDTDASARELAIGGWFEFNPVPCPMRPGATSPLDDCGVDFTWLMAAPEELRSPASDGSLSIHPPVGPGFNPVLAFIDWSPPTGEPATAVILVGHFHDGRAGDCPAGERRTRCDGLFVVDSVAWILPGAIDLAGAPTNAFGLPVITVAAAISLRDVGSSLELAVAGWYQSPPPMRCAYAEPSGVPFLEPRCEAASTWLMAEPEPLIDISPSGMSVKGPTGLAILPVFPTATRPLPNPLPTSGTSSPVPVVMVGHFNDRRSAMCTANPGNEFPDARAACRSRFVVDAVAWLNGADRSAETIDWREASDPHPSPALDATANATTLVPSSTLLGVLIIPGRRVADVEPALARTPTDLTSEPTLWVVTVLEPSPLPSIYKGVYLAGPVARTLVFTADGRAYEDTGATFGSLSIR